MRLRGAGARVSHDSGIGARRISALSGRYIATPTSTRPALLTQHAAASDKSAIFFRRTDFRGGRIRGIDRDGLDRGAARRGVGVERGGSRVPARDRHRIAVRVCLRRRCSQLSTREHHLRSAAGAGRADPPTISPRQEGSARRSLSARAREAGPISVGICLTAAPPNCPARSSAFSTNCGARMRPLHTVRNYASDLEQLAELFSRIPGKPKPALEDIDALAIREWLGHLYEQRLTAVSMRRKLASVRSLFKFLLREGVVAKNVARMVRTPKAPKSLPFVMTAEQTNALVDGVEPAADKFERPYPARDLAIFELLYGCGLRISELVGLNLEDFDFSERWVRVRGKGKKERQVPYAGKASAALDRYLSAQKAGHGQRARGFLKPSRGAADGPRRARHCEVLCADGHRRFVHSSAQPAPCLCHASAERRRRSAGDPGTAGTCPAVDDAEVHAGVGSGSNGGL